MNGLSLFGRIAWRRDKTIGMRFDEALHDYSPAEIHEAVEEASALNNEFDREAVLKELMNKAPRTKNEETEDLLP